MRSLTVFLLVLGFALSLSARPKTHDAALSILGQPNFTSEIDSNPPTSRSLNQVDGVAIDPTTGKLFVSDSGNHRILRFSSTVAYQTFASAEAVFGQSEFDKNQPNRGGEPTASTLDSPANLCFDAEGNLWVADSGNARVLRFDAASSKTSGAAANGVIGQLNTISKAPATNSTNDSGFVSPTGVAIDGAGNLYVSDGGGIPRILRFENAKNVSGEVAASSYLGEINGSNEFVANVTDSALSVSPNGLSIDAAGRLWVADTSNHRVLRFDTPTVTGSPASVVLGQADLFSNTIENPPTAFSLNSPYNVTIAPDGTLWVSDFLNYRVLGFLAALGKSNGAAANIVLGQPNFTVETPPPYSARATVYPTQIALGREGSLFIGEFSNAAHVKRWSDPVTITAPKTKRASKSGVVVLRGRASGATVVRYRVPGQGGFKRARGTATNWNARITKLKRKRTVVTVRAIAFDNRFAPATVRVTKPIPKRPRR